MGKKFPDFVLFGWVLRKPAYDFLKDYAIFDNKSELYENAVIPINPGILAGFLYARFRPGFRRALFGRREGHFGIYYCRQQQSEALPDGHPSV